MNPHNSKTDSSRIEGVKMLKLHLIMCISGHIPLIKSELDKSVDLSLCGLAPAQSKMDLSF